MTQRLHQMLCVFLLLGLAACSQRERSNPLDPLHPDTAGRPQNLSVSSQRLEVVLKWFEANINDMNHVHVERARGAADFERVGTVAPGNRVFVDTDVQYSIHYQYRIQFAGTDWQTAFSDTVSITPGPYNFWVTDYQAGTLSRLTYDAAHIIFATPFAFFPRDVAVDTLRLQVWAADWTGRLLRQGLDGSTPFWIEGFNRPSRLFLQGEHLWLVQNGLTEILHLGLEGQLQDSLGGFSEISDLTSAEDAVLWVADRGDSTLTHVDGSGSFTNYTLAHAPQAIAASVSRSWIWIGTDSQLGQFSPETGYVALLDLPGRAVALSPCRDGRCWLLLQHNDLSGEAWLVNASGQVLVQTKGFIEPKDIVAVPDDGGCAVVDYGNGRIVRVSAQGEMMAQRSGFMTPERIVLE